MAGRALRLAVLVLLVTTGCAMEEAEVLSPSPIVQFDKDRLWVLAKAARFGDGSVCGAIYLGEMSEAEPEFEVLAPECEAWTEMFAEYLRANGLPTVEVGHIEDELYWTWFRTKRKAIRRCESQYDWKQRFEKNACDPFRHATKNDGKLSVDLGITFTGRATSSYFEDVPLERLEEFGQKRLGEGE